MTLDRRSLLRGGSLAALTLPGFGASTWAQKLPPSLNSLSVRANAGTIGVISGGADGTYVRIAADLAAVLDEPEGMRVLPILGKGSLQNLSDILVLRGVDVGIVQSDVLAFARREKLLPGVESLIQYIAKLYDEEVHVLARPEIDGVGDLAGRPVNFDVRGSGTGMTAALLFDALGVAVEPRHDPQDTALDRLKRGDIAALVYVAGKPARLFGNIPAGSGLKLLPLPATPALLETYLPAEFRRSDYPALVQDDNTIETLAVGAVMATYAWSPGTERHRKVARFVEAFTSKFPAFLQPPRHPKWREVNLAAQVPGWTRFNATVAPAPRSRSAER